MLTLAIDSAQEICTIALARDSQVLAEYHFYHKMNLLRRMMPVIDQVLNDAGVKTTDLDGIVASLGPGSFTGLRIGVTVAKSLAYTLNKPIVGVPTLDAMACGVACTATDLICPMIYARPHEVYWALYDSSGEVRVEEYEASALADVFDSVHARGARVTFCGTGAIKYRDEIHSKFGDFAFVAKPWASFARGAVLLEIGGKRLANGDNDDPVALAPLYVKKPTPVVRLETGEFEGTR